MKRILLASIIVLIAINGLYAQEKETAQAESLPG